MKTKVKKNFKSIFAEISPSLAIMIICILLGVAAGCVFTANSENGAIEGIIGEDIRALSESGTGDYSFLKTFFNLIKYPAASFFLAYSAFGIICIPLLSFFRGFVLSVSISSIISTFGKKGILTALSMFGIQTVISIPCLILITALSFDCSKLFAFAVLAPRGQVLAKKPNLLYFSLFFVFCVILLLLAAVMDTALTPSLLSLSLKTIL